MNSVSRELKKLMSLNGEVYMSVYANKKSSFSCFISSAAPERAATSEIYMHCAYVTWTYKTYTQVKKLNSSLTKCEA